MLQLSNIGFSASLAEVKIVSFYFFPSLSTQASRLEELFPVRRQLCLHGSHFHEFHSTESHWAAWRETLSRASHPEAAVAFLGLNVPCLSTCSQTVPLHRLQVHSRGPIGELFTWTSCPLSKWMSWDTEKMKTTTAAGMASRLGLNWLHYFSLSLIKTHSEPSNEFWVLTLYICLL